MKINVRHNEPVKAYKILVKKLNDEGVFKTLKSKEFYQSKAQRVKAKRKLALSRWRKEQKKKLALADKLEQKHLLYSKKAGLPTR